MTTISTLAVGTRVRAAYPNSNWGAGVITEVKAEGSTVQIEGEGTVPAKPYVVKRDDGQIGYFHLDQVEEIRELLVHLNVEQYTFDTRTPDQIADYLLQCIEVGGEGNEQSEGLGTIVCPLAEEI